MKLSIPSVKDVVKKWRRHYQVRWGNLRRLVPFSPVFGLDRGQSIDRYYIESFLAQNARDIQGEVLEIADNHYTLKFGGDRVTQSHVLHRNEDNPQATIVADLTHADSIFSNSFHCIVITQTLQYIYEIRSAIRTLHRILKPGGVVLATFPGISQISRYDRDRWGEYWRFTTQSAQRLFEEVFPSDRISVLAFGNVLSATAFLYGLSAEELTRKELDSTDPDYELLIAVRATKPNPETDSR